MDIAGSGYANMDTSLSRPRSMSLLSKLFCVHVHFIVVTITSALDCILFSL